MESFEPGSLGKPYRGLVVLLVFLLLVAGTGCGGAGPETAGPGQKTPAPGGGDGSGTPEASYQLVMTGWFEPQEARDIRSRQPSPNTTGSSLTC